MLESAVPLLMLCQSPEQVDWIELGTDRCPAKFEAVQLKLIQMVDNFSGIAHFVVIRYHLNQIVMDEI